jgi:hypothetical protein
MSKPFEQYLAQWFYEQTAELDPQPGDRYAAEFPDDKTAENVCESILELAEVRRTEREVVYEHVREDIQTVDIDGTPTNVVFVRRSGDDVAKPYEVSRWYATTMRNVLAEGGQDSANAALLMIYEAGVGIETLDTTQHLFAADGQLPLTAFQTRIRSDYSPLDRQGRALVRAVEDRLTFPSDPMEDLGPLRTYCTIYDACAREAGGELPELIPRLGVYLTEMEFDNDWFEKTEDEEALVSQANQILDRNHEHASRIDDAMGVTKDAESELGAYYQEEFNETVLERADWTTITRSEAANGELGQENGSGGNQGGKDGGDGPGTSPPPDRDVEPKFDSFDIDSDRAKVYGGGAEASGDRSVIAAISDGSFNARIAYDADVSDEPIAFTTSTGEDAEGITVDEEEITVSLSGLDPDAPTFYSLRVYVGHNIRSGTPENNFDFAFVPEWFYEALEDGTYGVDVEAEAINVRNEDSLSLTPAGTDEEPERVVRDVTEASQSVTLSQPLLLRPKAPPKIERLRCQIVESAETPVPINVDFLSEVEEASRGELQLPLAFAALSSPDNWAGDALTIDSAVVIDLDSGEFHSPSRGLIEIPDSDKRLLQLEQQMVKDGTPAPRETDTVEVGTGVPNEDALSKIGKDLLDAYTRLFNHFADRGAIPSTDTWDAETQAAVADVLETFLSAFERIETGATGLGFEAYRDLGTIQSTSGDVVWMTPFHPLMLAYGLRVNQWRDDLEATDNLAGFRFARFRSLFSPAGLSPYRWNQDTNEIFSGHRMANNHLWASYAPIEGPGSETPSYISDVVADKLEAFASAFPLLFRLHTERKLEINLINMGDLGPVIEGLYDFFDFVIDHPELNVPQINLQIYGGQSEGGTLERFFATETADSSLRDHLSRRDQRGSKAIVDELDQRVTYVHAGKQFNDDTRRSAHLTLFRGILSEGSGTVEVETFPKATRMDGLVPYSRIKVDSDESGIVCRSGAAFDLADDGIISRVGTAVNALEAGMRDNEFTSDRALSKVITSSDQTNLPRIWSESLWVLHVEPKVDLDFYVQSTSQAGSVSQDTLMIHYSDQYDATSPGFDVVTTTDKRDPYLQALRRVLDETPGLDTVQPETVLTRLVAIDGELALDIQQAEGNSAIELLGLMGGLAVSAELLARGLPQYEWIPISLNEFARHDRSYRSGEEGLLHYFGDGKASDDLCFIGVPRTPTEGKLSLKLWVVETKGGTASISKGVEQVTGAREKLSSLFDPEEAYADTGILRSEFGDVVTQIASRLYHYDVISEDRYETIAQHQEVLVDGDYTLDLLEDAAGNVGEIVRIQQDIALPDFEVKDDVRVLKLPTSVLTIINDPPTGANEIHPDLNPGPLSFDAPESTTSTPTASTPSNQRDQPARETATPAGEGADTEDTGETEPAANTQADSKEEEDSEATAAAPSSDDYQGTKASRPEPEPESASELDTAPGEKTPDRTETQPSSADADVSMTPRKEKASSAETASGYDWSEEAFAALTESLSESPGKELELDVSRLTRDLKEQFESLGVDVHEPNPVDVSIGPRKIGVNVKPKSGQKIESVLNALSSVSVHIQASGSVTGLPNPAEGAIRLEIPHGQPRDIYLREAFEQCGKVLREPLKIPLGVNTENEHITVDLLDEHHMLIGGATGSGKSNFLAACICSLVASQSPDQVRLSLLDPKGIDFGRFAPLPQVDTYLDTPQDCVDYLRELLDTELEARREKLRDRGASSVQEYNKLAVSGDFEPIPYRVIVIDEFADLIMTLSDSKDKFEESVGRLAQIGRALGYSIMLATQRPDVNIVSGNIKTNFNCRVSFELPSNTDSRVILDQPGAEDLEGAGDMIALTSAGDEYHLQAYRVLPEDAVKIRDTVE